MAQICGEAEAHIDPVSVYRRILERQEIPMKNFESVASTSVRAAEKVGFAIVPGTDEEIVHAEMRLA